MQAIADLLPRPNAHRHWVPGRGRFVPPPPPLQPPEAAAARIADRRAAADPGNSVAAAAEAVAEVAAAVAPIDLANLVEEEDNQNDHLEGDFDIGPFNQFDEQGFHRIEAHADFEDDGQFHTIRRKRDVLIHLVINRLRWGKTPR